MEATTPSPVNPVPAPAEPKQAGPAAPPAPDLVLRVCFAGNRELPADPDLLAAALEKILRSAGHALAQLAPHSLHQPAGKQGSGVAQFYSHRPPCLRLITGLAEGADALAAEVLLGLRCAPVRCELAAVLPFDSNTYRQSRTDPVKFDDLRARCAYVLELDGRYVAGNPGRPYRARAYRAQSKILLRHADVLLAVADPDAERKAGGTMETVQAALAFGLPVVFVHAVTGITRVWDPAMDFTEALAELASGAKTGGPAWGDALQRLITTIVADPDAARPEPATGKKEKKPPKEPRQSHGERLLKEYFGISKGPGEGSDPKSSTWLRQRLWSWFESRFRRLPRPPDDRPLEPFATYRTRATTLNYYYSGQYRGAFLLNYLLAVVVVLFAALSLVLLGRSQEPVRALFILGMVKLILVIIIIRNTHQANRGDWNDWAIDYRYLAERLRTQFYLPRLGSLHPPNAAQPRYASRALRQSAVDWLFQAIVRSVSPAVPLAPVGEPVTGSPAPTIRLNLDAAIEAIRDGWIAGQIGYHKRNHDTMNRLHHCTERLIRSFNWAVIVVVGLDLLILLGGALPAPLGASFQEWRWATPLLLFLAALLPAAVASLNGIRFQSECRRLADRSSVVAKVLAAHQGRVATVEQCIATARRNPVTNPCSWAPEVLQVAESCARDLTEEVAEWSVLYAKEVTEP